MKRGNKKQSIELYCGDCLKVMRSLQSNSIDLILADPPYGTTACKWDSVIPFDSMWEELNKIIKHNNAIILFGSEPFSSALRMSNIKNYKYDWKWIKNISTNFIHAKRQPLRKTEDIIVFHNGSTFYYPIKSTGHVPTQNAKGSHNGSLLHGTKKRNYTGGETTRYPTNLLEFPVHDIKNRQHPTQKPVQLMEYLIKTYTKEDETVLDFTMGSGTTGVACKNLNRKFIGIEKDKEYFSVAKDRIEN